MEEASMSAPDTLRDIYILEMIVDMEVKLVAIM